MTRPLRVDAEDGWYHVTYRGIDRSAIFSSDALGGMDYTAVAMAIKRFERRAEKEQALRQLMQKVAAKCEK